MNVERFAREYVTKMDDPEKIEALTTADCVVNGSVLPQPIPAAEGMKILRAWTSAIPDIEFEVQQVTVDGNKATVQLRWGGAQIAPLSLPMPGMPTIPPTGKKVWVKDTYVLRVRDGKVSSFRMDSPADGSMPAALGQLGVTVPGM